MTVMTRNIVGLSAIAATIGLTVWDLSSNTSSSGAVAAQTKPATSPLVCEFDKARNTLLIRDTRNNHIAAAMFESFKAEDRVVTGVGGIYPKPGQIGIETGIQFKADFKERTCEAKHHKDSWGREALSAPMVSDLKAYTYTVK